MPTRPTIRQRLAGWLAPELRSAYPGGPGLPSPGTAAGTGFASSKINPRSALSVAAVWSAVNCYVNTIGSLDFTIAERDARGGRRPAPEHPAFDLLRSRPNARSTSMRLRQAWIGHACTYGNGYLEIEWDSPRRRFPVALHLMDPRTTVPKPDGDSIEYHQPDGLDPLPARDVLHLAMFGFDGVKGYSPVEVGRDTLGVATSQRDYQAGLFDNSAAAQGHLEVPGNLKTLEKAQLRTYWNRMHQGPSNAGNIGILEGGMRWVQTNFSPQDAEIIAGAKFSVEEVARLWNLPQHKLNMLDHATFSNVEELNLDFYQFSILPWLTAIEQECDNKLLSRADRKTYFAFHDVKTLLRGNIAAQTARDVAMFNIGARTVNQLLIADGIDPLDDPRADYHWIPMNNLHALETMGPPTAPAAPAPPPPPPPPASDPAPSAGALDALRAVLADPLGRMFRREAQAARKAARRGEIEAWASTFHAAHCGAVAEAIAPALRALAAATGRTIDPSRVASEIEIESRRQVRELVVSVPPDEMAGAVDRMCDRWESSRAADLANSLLPTEASR